MKKHSAILAATTALAAPAFAENLVRRRQLVQPAAAQRIRSTVLEQRRCPKPRVATSPSS